MKLHPFLFNEAGAVVDAGGGASPPVAAPPVAPPPTDVPWSEYYSKHAEPSKLEPYKDAKSWSEVHDLQSKRLADAQTALRTRQPGLPPRPAEGSAPEAFTAWRAAHGIPETAEGYGLTRPESVPEGAWNAEEARAFETWAHNEGLSPDLVKKLQAFDVKRQQAGATVIQQQEAKKAQELHDWENQQLGERFGDKLDTTLRDLQTVTQACGDDPGIFDPASDKFCGVHLTHLFSKMVARIPRGEDGTMRNIGAPSSSGAYDKAWAKAVLDPAHPDYKALNDPKDPRHAEINRLRNEAYALG